MNNENFKLELLKTKILSLYKEPGFYDTKIKGFSISRRNAPTELKRCFYKPMVILLLQGNKHTIFGNNEYVYKANQYIISTVDIPTMSRVQNASIEKPCIGLIVELDSYLIAQLMSEAEISNFKENEKVSCFSVGDADEFLIDAFLRLCELLEQDSDKQKILAPMIIKEIHYLLLSGPNGSQLRAVNTKGTQYNKIASAINTLKENFKEKLDMEKLAQNLNMAPSSFYRNFKKVTTISPLHYQKQLRLYEAQRLMLTGEHNAESASYLVGYESPTQFSREYKKMFGNPPKTDINKFVMNI